MISLQFSLQSNRLRPLDHYGERIELYTIDHHKNIVILLPRFKNRRNTTRKETVLMDDQFFFILVQMKEEN